MYSSQWTCEVGGIIFTLQVIKLKLVTSRAGFLMLGLTPSLGSYPLCATMFLLLLWEVYIADSTSLGDVILGTIKEITGLGGIWSP